MRSARPDSASDGRRQLESSCRSVAWQPPRMRTILASANGQGNHGTAAASASTTTSHPRSATSATRVMARMETELDALALELDLDAARPGGHHRLAARRGRSTGPRRDNALRVARELGVEVRMPTRWMDSRRRASAVALALSGTPRETAWRERILSGVYEEGRPARRARGPRRLRPRPRPRPHGRSIVSAAGQRAGRAHPGGPRGRGDRRAHVHARPLAVRRHPGGAAPCAAC